MHGICYFVDELATPLDLAITRETPWAAASSSLREGEPMARIVEDHLHETEEYETDSGDEEDWWRPDLKLGDKVQVMIKILINSNNINKIFSRFTSRGTGRSSGRRRWCCPRAVSTPQSA